MIASLAFPVIDPVAIRLGPLEVHWYALAYLAGLVLGWRFCVLLIRRPPLFLEADRLEDLLIWATFGIILGGRLGYVLFYNPAWFLSHPDEILMIWRGGMSFHGGFLGVIIAATWFARRHAIPALLLADMLAVAAPIGLFFGRVANFVNGELYGRISDLPWAVVFPNAGPLARHPSQLYEAALEGVLLFAILSIAALATTARHRPGLLLGLFLAGYGLARAVVEQVREPDAHMGLIAGPFTMGQLLSAPMIVAGLWFLLHAIRQPRLPDSPNSPPDSPNAA